MSHSTPSPSSPGDHARQRRPIDSIGPNRRSQQYGDFTQREAPSEPPPPYHEQHYPQGNDAGRQRPQDSSRNRHDQQYENTAQHQAPVNASHLYPEGLDRHYQQLPYRQDDDASRQRPKDSSRNRHDQQHDNTAQHQALVNASYPYPEGPGHSGRQKPGSQKKLPPPGQTRELRATHSSPPDKHQTMVRQTPLFRESQLQGPPNIVVFGETGTGKSSLINMLSGEDTAMIHDRAVGCTFESAPYPVSINGKRYTMWDTAGLNEGSAGSVPADQALLHLRTLVDKLEAGVSLLVYCIRGERYRNITKVNYDLFTQIICQGEVPVVVVVTGLENENRMEDWWEVNANQFSARGLHFDGHACVTTSKGKENGFEKEYQESKRTVSTLINDLCPGTAWVVDSELWFARIAKHTQEYWENYNGSSHHTRRLKGEREAEETQRLFGVGRFLHSLAQKISTLLVDRHS